MTALLLALPLLPLAAAAAALVIGRRLRWGGGELVFAATALSFAALLALPDGQQVSAPWFESGRYQFEAGLEISRLTWYVAMVVNGTAVGVTLYSLGYMVGKDDRPRFFAEFGLFIGAMLVLVLAQSLVLLFAAWEVVGLASFLLIGFDYRADDAPPAAIKAFLMTRLGDLGLLLGWLLAVLATGQDSIAAFVDAVQRSELGQSQVTLIAFLVLAGAIGKSAQLPLTGWLPDAMVGPTPVSALIHSATLVAAGVFLVLRLYPVFAAAPAALDTLAWVGSLTALFSAIAATAETDLKRVLAWSTSSHLGEMMLALGLGGPVAAAFHLGMHAAYKSTLFLTAGSVQEGAGTRNLDRLGGLIRSMPVTGFVFLIGALALAGVPPFAGFWSEDAILGVATQRHWVTGSIVVLISFLGGVYISRATIAVFFKPRLRLAAARELRGTLGAGMLLLAAASTVLGVLLDGRIAALLPFDVSAVTAGATWRSIALIGAVAGLGLGGMRGWRVAAPALGTWSARLAPALMRLTVAPVRPLLRIAEAAALAESWLDRRTERFGAALWRLARVVDLAETVGFAGGGDTCGAAVWQLAQSAASADMKVFGGAGDRFAKGLRGGSERLSSLQSGKLYLYTLGAFLWAGLALVTALLLIWL